MDAILYTAMSGAKQAMDDQSVVTNNLANVNTSGFKAQLSAMRAVPVQGPGALDTRASVAATTPMFDASAGPVNTTGRPLDIAIRGDGWLAVQAEDGTEAYTRRGDLQLDANGMLRTGNGRPVIGDGGPVVVPPGSDITIGEDGTLTGRMLGANPNEVVPVERLKLASDEGQQLVRGEDGLFRPVNGGQLEQDETLRVASGALEGSNVSAVESMVAMINNQRHYDMQMKVISDADENAQRANNLLSSQG